MTLQHMAGGGGGAVTYPTYDSLPEVPDGSMATMDNGTSWTRQGGEWYPNVPGATWTEWQEGGVPMAFNAETDSLAGLVAAGWTATADITDVTGVEFLLNSGDEELRLPGTVPSEFMVMLEGDARAAANNNNTPFRAYSSNGDKSLACTWTEDGELNKVAVVRSSTSDGNEGSYYAAAFERVFWHVRESSGDLPGWTRVLNKEGLVVSYQTYTGLNSGGENGFVVSTASSAGHSGAVRRVHGWVLSR